MLYNSIEEIPLDVYLATLLNELDEDNEDEEDDIIDPEEDDDDTDFWGEEE